MHRTSPRVAQPFCSGGPAANSLLRVRHLETASLGYAHRLDVHSATALSPGSLGRRQAAMSSGRLRRFGEMRLIVSGRNEMPRTVGSPRVHFQNVDLTGADTAFR
jgi:hypothetical protein